MKNTHSGISKAVSALKTERRLLLSGTPVQNDLDEFYAVVRKKKTNEKKVTREKKTKKGGGEEERARGKRI